MPATVTSIDRAAGVLTYSDESRAGGGVMATRWFDLRDRWAFLAAVKVDGKFRVSWQFGLEMGPVLGVRVPPDDPPSDIAHDAVKPFALRSTLECVEYEFATRKQARAAVEAANRALQAAYPMEAPPWATVALVHGWTPPEVSQ